MMASFDKETLAVIISDIHLGDVYCNIEKFEQFLVILLQDITDGHLAHLKALVILGDTFDNIMSTYRNLCVNPDFKRIY